MLKTTDVLHVLWLAQPMGLTEPQIRRDAGELRRGTSAGESEAAEALARLKALGFAECQTDALSGDRLWVLTDAGKAQARTKVGIGQ